MKVGTPLSPSGRVVLDRCGRRGRIASSRRGYCTWCNTQVKPPRQTWCGDGCVERYNATQPGHQTAAVFARDQGVCSDCQVDCEALASRLRCNPREPDLLVAQGVNPKMAQRLRNLATRGHRLWNLEHKVPLHLDGHPFDMQNAQTLCVVCHAAKSAAEARARAQKRKTP